MNLPKKPVALFGFNRPDCTKAVFEAIRRHQPDQLFLVADGPRLDVAADKSRCESVRAIMRSVDWKCEVHINFTEYNLGCKKRMSSGIDWVFSKVEEAIFLEDDCVPCPEFFKFCSEMLTHYRDNPRVMHIGGSNFQAGQPRGEGSYYFSRFIHIWGWASWRRAWQHYDVAMLSWPLAKKEKWMAKLFSMRIEREYWSNGLEQVYTGKLDTWDYQWTYACWRQNGIGIIPNANLITNIGAGPDATHTKGTLDSLAIATGILGPLQHPQKYSIDVVADKFTFSTHCGGELLRHRRHPLTRVRRGFSKLKRIVKRIRSRS